MYQYRFPTAQPLWGRTIQPPARLGQTGAVNIATLVRSPLSQAMAVAKTLSLSALAAGTVWVGINTGINGKGFIRIAGWTVGIASGLLGLAQLAEAIAPPSETTTVI